MLTALHIGADPVLLQTRGALLESAGLRVVCLDSVSRALEAVWAAPFDLAILCHSLSRRDRRHLLAAIRRRNPSALVLLVSAGPGVSMAAKEGLDAVLEPEPRILLQRLREILRAKAAGGAASDALKARQANSR